MSLGSAQACLSFNNKRQAFSTNLIELLSGCVRLLTAEGILISHHTYELLLYHVDLAKRVEESDIGSKVTVVPFV